MAGRRRTTEAVTTEAVTTEAGKIPYIGKPVDPSSIPVQPLAVATVPVKFAPIPVPDQAKLNVRSALGIERAEIEPFVFSKRTYNLCLEAVYKVDPQSTPQSTGKRMITKYVIIDVDRNRRIATLSPNQGIGFLLERASESIDPNLIGYVMDHYILRLDWLLDHVYRENLRPHIIGLVLTFGLVQFAHGDNYLGSPQPISDADRARVESDYRLALQTIAATVAKMQPTDPEIAGSTDQLLAA